jgi:hypothetical protein
LQNRSKLYQPFKHQEVVAGRALLMAAVGE